MFLVGTGRCGISSVLTPPILVIRRLLDIAETCFIHLYTVDDGLPQVTDSGVQTKKPSVHDKDFCGTGCCRLFVYTLSSDASLWIALQRTCRLVHVADGSLTLGAPSPKVAGSRGLLTPAAHFKSQSNKVHL